MRLGQREAREKEQELHTPRVLKKGAARWVKAQSSSLGKGRAPYLILSIAFLVC